MERLVNEERDVSMHAFGVGRGVDKVRLSVLLIRAATQTCRSNVRAAIYFPAYMASCRWHLVCSAGIVHLQVELLHIIAACGAGDPEERYMGLRVLDEHPW